MPDLNLSATVQSSRRQSVNNTLRRIKSEMDEGDVSWDDESYEEATSPPPRPQQFFKDLDDSLASLNRDDYIRKLLHLCSNDQSRLSDYRNRLAERARGFPNCPQTRLVNRRNTNNKTKELKLANDCFVLNSFTTGEHTSAIQEVFSQAYSAEPIIIQDNETLDSPDTFAILSRLQADMSELKQKSDTFNRTLQKVCEDVSTLSANYRVFQGTLNSVLARLPTQTAPSSVAKLQNDVTRLSSSLATVNQRLLDNAISTPPERPKSYSAAASHPPSAAPQTTTAQATGAQSSATSRKTHPADASSTCRQRNSDLPESPPTTSTSRPQDDVNSQQRNIDASSATTVPTTSTARSSTGNNAHTLRAADIRRPDSSPTRDTNANFGRFIAVKRRKIVPYYISNIDASVVKQDIYDYLNYYKVKATQIMMFYGRNGSSAKVNIYYEDEKVVDAENFWPPEVACRKWVNKPSRERTRDQSYRRSRPERQHQQYDRYNRYTDDYHDSDYDTREENQRDSPWYAQDDWNRSDDHDERHYY